VRLVNTLKYLREKEMPVIRDIPLSLKTREVLHREGFREHSKVRTEIKSLILELLASVKKAHLVTPAAAYEIYPITGIGPGRLSLKGNMVVHSPLFPSLLPGAKELAALVTTIGPGLEKQVADYTNGGEPLRGLLLDGIGSAAVDSLAQEACKLVAGEALSRGYEVSRPFSPGMPCGLPITEQRQLLEMVPSREIGVSLTAAGVMVPRKSVSMVIGIGPQMNTRMRAEVCARCNLRETCPYRIQSK
jgi:hypothetical protein